LTSCRKSRLRAALSSITPWAGTFGPPHDRARNEAVLVKALAELPRFTRSGEIRDLRCEWQAGGSRAWEDALRAEMLHDR
jgi:hypothetical protein